MLQEPPLIKSYTDIKQYVKQPATSPKLSQSYAVYGRAMKLTTTSSGRITSAKRQIGEA